MGIEVARRPAELGSVGQFLQHLHLNVQALGEHPDLFSQPGGRSRLSVRMRQHRDVVPLRGPFFQPFDQSVEFRQVDFGHGLLEGQGDGRVVDVLRGKAEVDEFLVALQPQAGEQLLEEVLDRFYIVVGRLFDVLDPLGVLEGKVGVEAAQIGKCAFRYAGQLGQLCTQSAQGDEVFYFHLYAVTY